MSTQSSSFSRRRYHDGLGALIDTQKQGVEAKAANSGESISKDGKAPDDGENKNISPSVEQYDAFSPIYKLMYHPTLFEPVRAPRYPIVLCHVTFHTIY